MKRSVINECKISFPPMSVNEAFARTVTAAFAAQCDPTVKELSELKTAVSEAVTNSIVHAYRTYTGNVELILRQLSGGIIQIIVRDKGKGISDIAQAMTPLFTTAPEEERSGLGFSVMESFMDKVSVKSIPDKGTTVTMEKQLSIHTRSSGQELQQP